MKRLFFVTFCCSVLASVVSFGQVVTFKANLDQAQAGGTGSSATGTALLCFDPSVPDLTINVTFNGLTTAQITGFHIHAAPTGTNGPIVFGMVNPAHDLNDFASFPMSFSSRWDPADTATGASALSTQAANLMASNLYFNAHTAAFPAGEIRGQIVPVIFGDINQDGIKDLLDVFGFINILNTGAYQIEADINKDGIVNLLDVSGFVAAILAGGC